MAIEERLRSLGIVLSRPAPMKYDYSPVSIHRGVAYLAGQVAKTGPQSVPHPGRVGEGVSVEQAQESARLAVLNGLAWLRQALGGLDAVDGALRLTGYVVPGPGFTRLSDVVDGATGLLGELLGPAGRCPRSVVGVSQLAFDAPVLLEMTFSLRSGAAADTQANG